MNEHRNPRSAPHAQGPNGAPSAHSAAGNDPPRVAVIADCLGSPRVAHTLAQLRERGVPGYELDVLAELTEGRHDLAHLCAPGPAAVAATLVAARSGLPVVATYHHEREPYTPVRPTDSGERQSLDATLTALYGRCQVILSPGRSADLSIERLGVARERIVRWDRGVDLSLFSPGRYAPDALPAGFNLLYAGTLSREKGVDLLAEAFLLAHDRDPQLRLVLAGAGPEERTLRARLPSTATFLGWLDAERLAGIYATADLLVFPSATDTFSQVILEAQASGLPVLAVDAVGSAELIESGRSGCLVAPEPEALASAIRGLARRATLRDRLATGGLMTVRGRSWERSSAQLGEAYARALIGSTVANEVARAA